MSRPSTREIATLAVVANELRESFAVESYTVGKALDANRAFRNSGSPRAALARTIALEAIGRGAAKAGIGLATVAGGGRDLQSIDGRVFRQYRVRLAEAAKDGVYRMLVNSDSLLALDGDSLYFEERWVFGYTLTDLDQPGEVFVAEVLGISDGNPMYLLLGTTIPLDSTGPPSGGFRPTEEGLDGFDEDEDEDDGWASGPDSDVG